tara:strand:- start:534 stop:1376 length:843 start_codon:yes stop_codon:yes gene_type:complete
MKTINRNIYSAFLVFALLPDIHSQNTDGIDTNDDRNESSEKLSHLFESTAVNIENSISKIILQSNTLTENQNDIIKLLNNMVVNIKNIDNNFNDKLITLRDEQIDFSERMKKHSEKLIANQNLNNSNIINSVKFFDGSINKLRVELSLLKSTLNEDQKQFVAFRDSQLNALTNLMNFAEEAIGDMQSNRALLNDLKNENIKHRALIKEIDNKVKLFKNQQDANHNKTEALLAKIDSRLSLSFVLKAIVITLSLILMVFIWKYKHTITQVINSAPNQGKER